MDHLPKTLEDYDDIELTPAQIEAIHRRVQADVDKIFSNMD